MLLLSVGAREAGDGGAAAWAALPPGKIGTHITKDGRIRK